MQTRSQGFTGAVRSLALITLLTACADPPTAARPDGAVSASVSVATELRMTQGFRKQVTLEGVREHLMRFEALANAAGGSATVGSPAAAAIEQYIHDRMIAAGYDVAFDSFDFLFNGDVTRPVLARISPAPVSYVNGVDFTSMSYSGNGDVTATVQSVDLTLPPVGTSNSGCTASDFVGFVPGRIALVQRGACTFAVKAQNAQAAGASAVIIMNAGTTSQTGVFSGTLGAASGVTIPVVSTSHAVGVALSNVFVAGDQIVRIKVDRRVEMRTGRNVIAESDVGDPSQVVVIGAPITRSNNGPGIVESSGAAAILEIAEVFASSERTPRNLLRFIWFSGATGGAFEHVDQLSAVDVSRIALMLSFDALASPNFARLVADGNQDGPFTYPVVAPPGSGAIEQSFLDYFGELQLSTDATPLPSFDSPSRLFVERGIPAGALSSGSTQVKTAAQQALFGGTAGVALNPCFNLACDTMANVNDTALDQLSDAAAHATLTFSRRNFAKSPLVAP